MPSPPAPTVIAWINKINSTQFRNPNEIINQNSELVESMDFNWQHISIFEGEWGAPHFATPGIQYVLFFALNIFTQMGGKMHLCSKNSWDKISLSCYPELYFNRHLKVIRCGIGVFSVCLAILLYDGSIQHKHHTAHTKEVEHCC